MIKKLLILPFLLTFLAVFSQKAHTVAKGDNPYNIAKKYGMTMEELTKLNPGITDRKLAIGDVLKVSGKKPEAKPVIAEKPKPVSNAEKLGTIVLQPKQTVYGITKQYHISEADLRRLNPDLNNHLKIGDEVTLPAENIKKYADKNAFQQLKASPENTKSVEETPAKTVAASQDENWYTVQSKDNYYRIGKQFGLTQSQLFALNPGLESKGLQPGEMIRIKGTATASEKTQEAKPQSQNANMEPVKTSITQDYVTYTVQDGDTVFGILNKFGISLDELLTLNPQLSDGLKVGMVLKIKKMDSAYVKKSGDALGVVIMLPFGFDVNDSKYRSMSADFLSGAKLALERNAKMGLKMDVKIVDAGNEESFKKNLIQINQDNTDIIIGPFFKSNVLEVLNYVGSKKIPVVAPFANSSDLFDYSNLIIVEPENKTYAERIAKEIAQVYSDQKIYIVADDKKENANLIKNFIDQNIKNASITMVNSASEIQADKNMMTGQSAPVIAVLADDDTEKGNVFSSKIIELSNETQGMKAFSMFYQPSFEKKTEELGQASLVYLMDRKINTEGDFEKEILADFKDKYCKTPSKFAVVGFDVVNDILSRENKKGEIFRQIGKAQTQLATKFEYVRAKNNGAYINTGYRVVRLIP